MKIERMLATGERKSGSGVNQMGNLQRSGATRWSSHYDSIQSLIDMYTATCNVLEYLTHHSPNARYRAEACGTYKNLTSYEFVFILHLISDICSLAEKFYPKDFSVQDIRSLEYELRHYELDMKRNSQFQVSTLVELCQQLTESGRSDSYIMLLRTKILDPPLMRPGLNPTVSGLRSRPGKRSGLDAVQIGMRSALS
ncbi:Uncharacterized protein Adt_27984 [Abeliophyllum distichum]|uniref:Uncharacterized protein n=1 Tax=Abeliophyllum distichum TaxID=126358 RepID=A0ABD1RV94_9LAMI